ncbi:fibrinogen-like protein 1 [Cynoglossus semilaevis]|uniref:Fibrinogen-like protein 1 n=1 Tax=Cynoglossus semilaevis TaxID=244447 RepID=A0A3P8WW37_CYNSE|nr:fibrinogen-like protein 1 [Cynoglossus semilaevis]XP_024918987.1 fibrinogen-like protein 1 [Cynoglossus semilaevis]XP_024918988.1 fibrinogen-like protein 1 [Cynoglossus semilaevis]XP_024918989.1 fibrinogen-like protein 1 [Cynoglossus semilaevis]XP_024918990.1 fibrinogen-like protein 1 [Cynoglossus semilaevis]XP_024918991.1 fibrinogen-like protein 1 [Cynoglossus semilaevis]
MSEQMFRRLIVLTAFSHFLCSSDVCREEVTTLRQQEKLLEDQLHKQELLLLRLQLLDQPDHRVPVNQSQDPRDTDCAQLFTSGFRSSGSYRVQTGRVYCDMSDGGGWTVLQRRTNGGETFNRSWTQYKDGFGDLESESGEFWIGNDKLHNITSQGNYTLRINLEDFDGNQRYAEYQEFKVANEEDFYRLTFGAYTGTAGDALSGSLQVGVSEWAGHRGMKFTTYDQDNDNYRGNCAREDKGGWWFNKCHSAHLNGVYYSKGHYSAVTDDGIVWYTWRGWWYSLKTTIMKLRPTDFRVDPADDPGAVPLH